MTLSRILPGLKSPILITTAPFLGFRERGKKKKKKKKAAQNTLFLNEFREQSGLRSYLEMTTGTTLAPDKLLCQQNQLFAIPGVTLWVECQMSKQPPNSELPQSRSLTHRGKGNAVYGYQTPSGWNNTGTK